MEDVLKDLDVAYVAGGFGNCSDVVEVVKSRLYTQANPKVYTKQLRINNN